MNCTRCNSRLRKIRVEIEGARSKALSYQCSNCGHVEFDQISAGKVLKELKWAENPLLMKQKIIKLSQNRLGIYFNQDLARSLRLKAGKEIYVAVPDKKRIVLNIKR